MEKALSVKEAATNTFGIKIAQSAFAFHLNQLFERLNLLNRQVAEFCSTKNHMSKRGSPYLRHAIFLATSYCSFHDNPLNDYYKKKRTHGKHHLSAVEAVSNKLTTVIYAVLRDGKPYETVKFV